MKLGLFLLFWCRFRNLILVLWWKSQIYYKFYQETETFCQTNEFVIVLLLLLQRFNSYANS